MNTSASAVSGKQRDPTSQGYCTAARLFSDDHTSFTASDRTHTSVYRTVSDPHGSRARVCGKGEICKVCTQDVSRPHSHRDWDYLSIHANTVNEPPIPKAGVDSADSATQCLTF